MGLFPKLSRCFLSLGQSLFKINLHVKNQSLPYCNTFLLFLFQYPFIFQESSINFFLSFSSNLLLTGNSLSSFADAIFIVTGSLFAPKLETGSSGQTNALSPLIEPELVRVKSCILQFFAFIYEEGSDAL